MPVKIKMRSMSVEDLGIIVKQMIDGVLENDEQVTKLHQVVFEEYYLKKMEELKEVKAKIDAEKVNEEAKHFQIQAIDKLQETNAVDHFISQDDYPDKELTPPDILSGSFNESPLQDDCDYNTIGAVFELAKSATALNLEKAAGDVMDDLLDEIDTEKLHEDLYNMADAPVVHVIRRPRITRLNQDTLSQAANIRDSDTPLDLINHCTTTDLTETVKDPVSGAINSGEQLESKKNVSCNVDIIEWRRCPSKEELTVKKKVELRKTREIPVQFKSKAEAAFEDWKREKTNTYHRIFREEQKRKRLEQAEKARQLEKKQAANEAYQYWRRQQDVKEKLINSRKRIMAQMESQRLGSRDKRSANSQAFKAWKRQKDVKLRETKMYMMAYNPQSYPQQQTPKPQNPRRTVNVTFDTWLDQLDCVLHQKYLRERRYLVRSFYCQPAYFGTAALCT